MSKPSGKSDDSEFYYSLALQDMWYPAQMEGYPSALCVRYVRGATAIAWMYGITSEGVPDKTVRVEVSLDEVGEMIRLLKQLKRHMKSREGEKIGDE